MYLENQAMIQTVNLNLYKPCLGVLPEQKHDPIARTKIVVN